MKCAFLFSPQGSQFLGMGKDLYEHYPIIKQRIDEANQTLKHHVINHLFHDATALEHTQFVQTAMYALSCAIQDQLEHEGIHAKASAGLSLGECFAYYHQGVYDFSTGLSIINERGRLMHETTQTNPGVMAAVRSDKQTVVNLVNAIEGIYLANVNAADQLVISGRKAGLDAFKEQATSIKRIIPLKTAGAFHSPLMQSAADKFAQYIEPIDLKQPKGDLYANVTATLVDEPLKPLMSQHISQPVLFHDMLKKMIADGYDTFIEIGPKPMLAKFVKKIDRDLNAYSVHDVASLKHVVEELV